MKKNKALDQLRQEYERSIVNESSFLQEYKAAKELRQIRESSYCIALIGKNVGSIGTTYMGDKRMLLGARFDHDGEPIQITIAVDEDGNAYDSSFPHSSDSAQIIKWI